jgi:hypothetical protein
MGSAPASPTAISVEPPAKEEDDEGDGEESETKENARPIIRIPSASAIAPKESADKPAEDTEKEGKEGWKEEGEEDGEQENEKEAELGNEKESEEEADAEKPAVPPASDNSVLVAPQWRPMHLDEWVHAQTAYPWLTVEGDGDLSTMYNAVLGWGKNALFDAVFYVQSRNNWYKWGPFGKEPDGAALESRAVVAQLRKAANATTTPKDKGLEITLATLYIAKAGVEADVAYDRICNAIHDAWCAVTMLYEKGIRTKRKKQFVDFTTLSPEQQQMDEVWVRAVQQTKS